MEKMILSMNENGIQQLIVMMRISCMNGRYTTVKKIKLESMIVQPSEMNRQFPYISMNQ